MLSSVRSILRDAVRRRYAVGAFNMGSLESLRAIVGAAEAVRAPVIVQTSGGEVGYFGPHLAVTLVAFFAKHATVPVALHLDHSPSFEAVKEAVQAGYTSVHIDGSALPHKANIALTRKVVRYCHARGVFVEGEIGHLGGTSEPSRKKIAQVVQQYPYTDPSEARAFARATGVDSLAVTFGNAHGVFAQAKKLDFTRLAAIHRAVSVPLVHHGGSGTRPADFHRSIRLGVRKVNMNTQLRIAYHDTLAQLLCGPRDIYKPYDLLPPVIAAMQKVTAQHMRIFGAAGKAGPRPQRPRRSSSR